MPTYEAQCESCGQGVEYIRSIGNRNLLPTCPLCGGSTRRIIATAPQGYVTGQFKPFKSTIDGSVITTYAQLREHNRRNDVINLNDMYSEEKILSGDLVKPPAKEDPKKDVIEALKMVKEGYKPVREEYTDVT